MTSLNSEQQAAVADWIVSPCFEPQNLGESGGAILLGEPASGFILDLRPFVVGPVAQDKIAAVAADLAAKIIREAEAQCAGKGGGTREYVIRAYKDVPPDAPKGTQAQRKAVATRPISITVEREVGVVADIGISQAEQTVVVLRQAISLLSSQAAHVQEANRALLAMAGELRHTCATLSKSFADANVRHEQLQADNFALLRANIENREGREAEAFATLQRTEDFRELKNMLLPELMKWWMERKAQAEAEAAQPQIPAAAPVQQIAAGHAPQNGVRMVAVPVPGIPPPWGTG